MGWEEYVTNMIAKGANQCGVYTLQGAACAQSAGFDMPHTEILALKTIIDGGEAKIEINRQPCAMISFDKEEGTVQAKTKNLTLQDSKVFYHIECTKGLMIVCGMIGVKERNACPIAHDICKYLKELNF